MISLRNGRLFAYIKLLFAFVLGAGTAVAAAYNTFETTHAHQVDQERTEQMLQEIRGDVKQLLERMPHMRMPTDGNRPRPQSTRG